MLIVPLSDTEIRKRQRTSINSAKLHELKEKILAKGLLHPPVYWHDVSTNKFVLTAGERRTKAIQLIHAEGKELRCDNIIIPRGCIPITRLDEYLDEIARFEAELDENVAREDLEWPDRVRAFADLHMMRRKLNPEQTLLQTGAELVARGMTSVTTDKRAEHEVSQSVIIAQHLDNDKIANARNPAEAVGLIYKMEEEKITAALVKRQLATLPEKPSIQLRHGDALGILPGLDSGTTDLIVVDPPYGLGASDGGFRQRTVHHHNYEDTPENARALAQLILVEGFRICKTRANIFMFCDIALFDWLKVTAANMGWSPFRRPLIWKKSESEGLAPWGGQGPRITTEFIFYATKGQRGLHASPIDVFDVKRVPRKERLHAAEKPVELLTKLITCATLPGDTVLDPCCGSGSTLVACRDAKRQALGIEMDLDYFNTAMANVYGGDLKCE
jgi:site-specific DNA-methyltransferase (adenine-specific)